jgi:hypothetical protein
VWVPDEDAVNPFEVFVGDFYGFKEQHRGETRARERISGSWDEVL